MNIAQSKRRENIAEYILYLWQLEDLLRALQFSPEAVYSQLVQPRNPDAQTGQELLVWYMELANLLRQEGKETTGHLDHTLHIINDLQQLHMQLLAVPAGARYRDLFARLSPELPRLRELVGESKTLAGKEPCDIELVFRTLYAAMLYRIKGGEKNKQIASEVTDVVSPVAAELVRVFHLVEKGEIDLSAREDE